MNLPAVSLGPAPLVAEPPTFAESFAAAEQAALGFLVGDHGFHLEEREVGRAGSERGVFGRVVYRSTAVGQGPVARA